MDLNFKYTGNNAEPLLQKLNSTEADKTCTLGISRINTKRTVRPKALVALAVAGGPRCYLPVTSGPEDGESAGVDVGAAGSVSRVISDGSPHKDTEKEDRARICHKLRGLAGKLCPHRILNIN